jgi:3,4-dihydroxy 2-butanone 4-phosphate synthase/GTP cyclohydrolase II
MTSTHLKHSQLDNDLRAAIAAPEEIIEEARNGHMFIMVDDENRENEGDLVIPGRFATPEAVNFMAKEGRGLICLAMAGPIIDRLGLELIGQQNSGRLHTAFTTSIEAREGVTTGISASDRAHTIQTAIDPGSGPEDIATPGHVFPLRAREGGVLVRAGHTEAAVDIARLAGLDASGVICEIMRDDGEMARLPELVDFARDAGLKIGTIADLIAYRRRNERLVERCASTRIHSRFGGEFALHVYRNLVTDTEHLALVKGDPAYKDGPVLVRMHAANLINDVLGVGEPVLETAMTRIGEAGTGVVVVINEPDKTPPSQQVAGVEADNTAPQSSAFLRDYGVGAQILLDLGVYKLNLLTNTPKTIIGLDGYGLTVCGQKPIE